MSLLQNLRNRLQARRADTTTGYWALLERMARDQVPERALEKALVELEAAAAALAKSPADVELDLELLREFVAADAGAAAVGDAGTAMRSTQDRAGAAVKRADALEAQAKRLRQDAENELHQARAAVEAARAARGERHRLLGRLRDAGYPAAAAELGAASERDLLAELQRQLAAVEADLADVRARQVGPDQPAGDADPLALEATIHRLERRRGVLLRHIEEKTLPRPEELV